MISIAVYIFLLIELLAISYIDFVWKKIPNSWAILNIFCFVFFLFFYPQSYSFTVTTFIYSFAFLVVGFILYLLKIMGPGDTKFLFSFYLLVPATMHEKLLICLIQSTLIVGTFFLIKNLIKNFDKLVGAIRTGQRSNIRKFLGGKFAFAPVILISWIWFGLENRKFLALN